MALFVEEEESKENQTMSFCCFHRKWQRPSRPRKWRNGSLRKYFANLFFFFFFLRTRRVSQRRSRILRLIGHPRFRTRWACRRRRPFFTRNAICLIKRTKKKGSKKKNELARVFPSFRLEFPHNGGPFPLISSSFTGFYRVFLGFTEFYRFLLGFTKFHWVSLGFTGFYRVLLGFTEYQWVIPSFTEFYLVLPSFTGFHWVLPSFT